MSEKLLKAIMDTKDKIEAAQYESPSFYMRKSDLPNLGKALNWGDNYLKKFIRQNHITDESVIVFHPDGGVTIR